MLHFERRIMGQERLRLQKEKKKYLKWQRVLVGWLWEKGKRGAGTHLRHCYPVSQTCMNWKSDYLAYTVSLKKKNLRSKDYYTYSFNIQGLDSLLQTLNAINLFFFSKSHAHTHTHTHTHTFSSASGKIIDLGRESFFPHQWQTLGASQMGLLVVKNLPANAGDVIDAGLIPRSGKSPGEGHGNPFQYSCLENLIDGGIWQIMVHKVAESQTWLKWLSMHWCKG